MISEVKLDINKAGQFINEPVTLRAGDTDNTIEVSVFQNGRPYTGISKATFNGTRIDGTVIANDHATVSGNTVTYNVAPAVTATAGKIRNAYFLLNGNISTENFEVVVLAGTKPSGAVTNYIPGFQELQDDWEKVSGDMSDKLNGIDMRVDNFLDSVHEEIDGKNSQFTSEQEKQVTTAMNDLKTQISNNRTDVNATSSRLTDIKDAVSNLKVGARNYALNSYDYSGEMWALPINAGTTLNEEAFGTKIVQGASSFSGPKYFIKELDSRGLLDTTTEWTMSEYVRTIGKDITATLTPYGPISNGTNQIVDNTWRRFSITFKFKQSPLSDSNNVSVRFEPHDFSDKSNINIQFAGFTLNQGGLDTGYQPAPEDKVNVSDTVNWQKKAITSTSGSVENVWQANDDNNTGNLKIKLFSLPVGFHTFSSGIGMANNPNSTEPFRGFFHSVVKSSTQTVGYGYMTGGVTNTAYALNIDTDSTYNVNKVSILRIADSSYIPAALIGKSIMLKDSSGKSTQYTIEGFK